MRILTLDDIIETYAKLNQRGINFIVSKFQFNKERRSKTAFNHESIKSSNWWIIPEVIKRWNKLVTGSENLSIEDFSVKSFLRGQSNLKMLSLGSGNCNSELKFAKHNQFSEILCTDISEIPLNLAKKIAHKKGLSNIKFQVQNANTFNFPKSYYDIIYFRASLHHFENLEYFISKSLKDSLKKNGYLIIDEYVGPNRLQFPKHQIKTINDALKSIPKKYRKRFNLKLYKNKVYGSGLLRMILADPSECIESEKILPTIRTHYKTVYEANYGGNILLSTLKDISHHFINLNDETSKILLNLFEKEDLYLENNQSDFVFGIYKKEGE
ncbi:class I SAM-dependent methyltransferase [Aestuariibaculum sp. YM273]|uniref:class I SAM-dependent methyltransferase n=1 Tax=Aestuariibaculum sp. YM273 TaxID=3070659 RepID=UPI0027DE29DB|nr:class I SAM-dependent methyltransferase [Aestuariibaculum sp. YM273]WMI65923.1 class I SAM-dependent methyltransferase [Aestuariibaculum sp. YM273]